MTISFIVEVMIWTTVSRNNIYSRLRQFEYESKLKKGRNVNVIFYAEILVS
jgi:hypothetical protein